MRSGRLIFVMTDASSGLLSYISPNKIPNHARTFLAVTVARDTNEGQVYMGTLPGPLVLDGTFNPSLLTPESITNTFPLFAGGNPIEDSNFRGRIDELEIYNRVLSHTEISNMYIVEAKEKCKPLDEGGDSGFALRWYLFLAALLVLVIVALGTLFLPGRKTR